MSPLFPGGWIVSKPSTYYLTIHSSEDFPLENYGVLASPGPEVSCHFDWGNSKLTTIQGDMESIGCISSGG